MGESTPTEPGPDVEAGGRSKRRREFSELPALCYFGQHSCSESVLLLAWLTGGCWRRLGRVSRWHASFTCFSISTSFSSFCSLWSITRCVCKMMYEAV